MNLRSEARTILTRFPSLCVASVATLLFAVFKHGAHFPLIADDYAYVGQLAAGNLHLSTFNFFTRRPLSTLLTLLLYSSRAPEQLQIQFYLTFFASAFSLSSIISYLRRPTTVSQYAVIVVFCLYPCLHEVLFMNLTLAWGLGALFWALSVRTERACLQVLGSALAAASLESYVLPMLLLPIFKKDFKRVATSALGVVAFLLFRLVLSRSYPPETYTLVFDLASVWNQIQNCFQFLFLIHFYKTYWFSTALQLIAFFAIAFSTKDRRLWLMVAFFSTVPMWFLSYYAPRAVHASVLLNLALFASFAIGLSSEKLRRTICAMLFIAYGMQLATVSELKENNSLALIRHENEIVKRLQTCPASCEIPLAIVNSGLKGDWVMPENTYDQFLNWIAIRHHFYQTLLVEGEVACKL